MSSRGAVSFQVTLSGSPQQLPNNSLVVGGTFIAKSTNTGNVAISPNPSPLTNGLLLEKGQQVSVNIPNTNVLYVLGTTNDILTFLGS